MACRGQVECISQARVVRKAVGQAAMKALGSELRAYLEPTQVGVGTRLGAEAVVHVARQ